MFLFTWPGGSMHATVTLVAVLLFIYVAALWIALVYWAARDSRRRSHSPAVQLAGPLTVLFGFVPGLLIYLVMRPRRTLAEQYAAVLEEEVLRNELDRQTACPGCARPIHDDFVVCPACRLRLKHPCLACARPLANAWRACPFCGADRPRPSRTAVPVPIVQPASAAAMDAQVSPLAAPARTGTGG